MDHILIVTTVGSGSLAVDADSGDDCDNSELVTAGSTTVDDDALTNLLFCPASNSVAQQTFTFKVHDGNSYSGVGTMIIFIIPVNDLPTTGDKTISATEDVAKMFASSDFTYSDVDSDSISHVKITTLETAGTLFYDSDGDDAYTSGEDVTLNQEIAIANIVNLGFVGASNANGNSYATFKFQVKDGTGYSSGVGTNTINLAAVNDAPTSAAVTVSGTEDTLNTYTAGNFAFSDVDSGDSISRILITVVESSGDLECQNKNGASAGWTDCAADDYVAAGTDLRLTPASDSTASVTFSFKVYDGAAYSASAYVLTTTFGAVNDAPAFSSSATSVNVNEGTTAVGTYAATDAESDTISYATSGTDGGGTNDLFDVSSSGVLTFKAARDYETPGCGSGSDSNTCVVIITATATGGSDTHTVTVSIQDLNDEDPVWSTSASQSVAENTRNVATLTVTDGDAADSNTATYAITTNDNSLFEISSGVLRFAASGGANYESPGCGGSSNSNTCSVIVRATDGNSNTADRTFAITITNVVVAVTDTSATLSEGAADDAAVVDVDATGDSSSLTWAIDSGDTHSIFAINTGTGAITVDDNSGLNYESATSYNLVVSATDGTAADTETITITISNVAIAITGNSATIAENVANNANVLTMASTGDDANGNGWSITDGNTDGDSDSSLPFKINSAIGFI
jgi:hypothetical protein